MLYILGIRLRIRYLTLSDAMVLGYLVISTNVDSIAILGNTAQMVFPYLVIPPRWYCLTW